MIQEVADVLPLGAHDGAPALLQKLRPQREVALVGGDGERSQTLLHAQIVVKSLEQALVVLRGHGLSMMRSAVPANGEHGAYLWSLPHAEIAYPKRRIQ